MMKALSFQKEASNKANSLFIYFYNLAESSLVNQEKKRGREAENHN